MDRKTPQKIATPFSKDQNARPDVATTLQKNGVAPAPKKKMSLAEYRTKKNGPTTGVEVVETRAAPPMTEEEIAELERLRNMDVEDTIRRMKVKAKPGRDPREFEWKPLNYPPRQVTCAQDVEMGGMGTKTMEITAHASLPPIVERDDSRYLPARKVASTATNTAKNPAPAPTSLRPSLPPLRTNSLSGTPALRNIRESTPISRVSSVDQSPATPVKKVQNTLNSKGQDSPIDSSTSTPTGKIKGILVTRGRETPPIDQSALKRMGEELDEAARDVKRLNRRVSADEWYGKDRRGSVRPDAKKRVSFDLSDDAPSSRPATPSPVKPNNGPSHESVVRRLSNGMPLVGSAFTPTKPVERKFETMEELARRGNNR